ncbi:MAG: DUF1697 domain-containing protein [Nitriliruptorales bacterium]|nr:DUF1697 domain-containing protein [Nitriliruptorales bacterium]
MIYVALLRGINVGGKNKVDMKEFKAVFEEAGMISVTTYINSGNVVFSSRSRSRTKLAASLEEAIAAHFGFHIKVLVRDLDRIRAVVDAISPDWVNDKNMKCDVMFLWEEVDRPDVLDDLTIKPAVDDVRHVPGAFIWKVDRANTTKSGMMKLVGTPLYQQMTIRNCNTTRKLLELMEAAGGR